MYNDLIKRGYPPNEAHWAACFFCQNIAIIRTPDNKLVDKHKGIRFTADNVAKNAPLKLIDKIIELGKSGLTYEIYKLDFINKYTENDKSK